MHDAHDHTARDPGAESHNRADLLREAQARDAESRAPRQDWQVTFRSRLGIAMVLVGLWAVVIQGRLVYLQVFQHDELLRRADSQRSRVVVVPAKRGDILDRNGNVLAYSVDGDAIYASPGLVVDRPQTVKAICAVIEGCTARHRDEMMERLGKGSSFQYLWRFASPSAAARVRELKLAGVGTMTEPRRYYPNRELGAHVLGFTGVDNNGLGGIEQRFDSQIAGKFGRLFLLKDAKSKPFERIERPPTAGASLELTIDRDIQYIAERELEAGVHEFGAEGGTIVILEPKTGDVLAMASYPTFNPNRKPDGDEARRRNRAIQEVYEPGSTFKIVTASAALEQKLARPDEVFDVSQGYIMFGSRRIDDVHTYPALTFKDVIVKSSNVGAIKIGQRVGPELMVKYARGFGFGSAIARDLPGQTAGILWKASQLNDSALASVSMGYQVGVTPVQMAAAVNSIATGGALMQPRLVRATIKGNVRTEIPPNQLGRSIKPETAALMTTIMESVVEEGTARTARIPGYTIAGKTGTAAKLENGRYSKSEYNASFVGFAPSRQPAVTVLVVIDSPRGKGYYGGTVAAPIFARVAEATLRHLGVPRNVDPASHMIVTRAAAPDPSGIAARNASTNGNRPRPTVATAPGVMPDLRGLGARAAVHELARLGLSARVLGEGLVTSQDIPAGTPVEQGTSCAIRLARVPAAVEPRATP